MSDLRTNETLIADLRATLAMRDAEIERLQGELTIARNEAENQTIAADYEHAEVERLRGELSTANATIGMLRAAEGFELGGFKAGGWK